MKTLHLMQTPHGAKVSDQVQVHIRQAVADGMDKVMVRLDPPELGRLEFKLSVDDNGLTRVSVLADKAETLDLLRADTRGLERALQAAGLKTDSSGLEFNLRSDTNAGRYAGDYAANADPSHGRQAGDGESG